MTRLLAFFLMRSVSYVGGAERRFESLATALPHFGVEFVVLAYSEDAPFLKVSPRFLISRASPHKYVRLILAGTKAVRAAKCDAVYAYHSDFIRVLIPSYVVSLLCRKPFVVVVHDDTKRAQDSRSMLGLLRLELTNGKGTHVLRRLTEFSNQVIRRLGVRSAAACICVSKFAMTYAEGTLRAKHPSLSGNGVGDDWFATSPVEKRFDAVFVGRVSALKGVYSLITAWKKVVARFENAKLLIIGPATPEDVKKVKSLIDHLEISRAVTVKGFVQDDKELRTLMSSSRIFVLPSRREGFGLAVAEAMAAGLPCVLSDIPAFVQTFGNAALLVPVDDSDALARGILSLLEDPIAAGVLAERGQELARSMKWEHVAAREATIIKATLPKSP
ncbi:MAG: glycosyltransferase family 4 protein [Nitrososphaerales archaeon]